MITGFDVIWAHSLWCVCGLYTRSVWSLLILSFFYLSCQAKILSYLAFWYRYFNFLIIHQWKSIQAQKQSADCWFFDFWIAVILKITINRTRIDKSNACKMFNIERCVILAHRNASHFWFKFMFNCILAHHSIKYLIFVKVCILITFPLHLVFVICFYFSFFRLSFLLFTSGYSDSCAYIIFKQFQFKTYAQVCSKRWILLSCKFLVDAVDRNYVCIHDVLMFVMT